MAQVMVSLVVVVSVVYAALFAAGAHAVRRLERARDGSVGRVDAAFTEPVPPSVEELALLAGGPARLLQVCALDLHLGGLLYHGSSSSGAWAEPTDRARRDVDLDALEPVRRSLIRELVDGRRSPSELLGKVVSHSEVRGALERLRERGLCTDAEGIHRLWRRADLLSRITGAGFSLPAVVACMCLFLVVLYGESPLLLLLAPPMAVATWACVALSRRWEQEIGPRTPEGERLLNRIRDHLRSPVEGEDHRLHRETVLRRVAAFGRLGLRLSSEEYWRTGHMPPADARGPVIEHDEVRSPALLWDFVNAFQPDPRSPLWVVVDGGGVERAPREWSPRMWQGEAEMSGWSYARHRPPVDHG
ncbi:TIGR04222 domain-containing membrane protein [Nocardiopsis alba]|uniref:TIGR04222 domain-containing membrane protein n=1 Tax=Nocardiopsis alba TaxID=53437 RepID=UPI0036719ECF